jgi:hypothetical protein
MKSALPRILAINALLTLVLCAAVWGGFLWLRQPPAPAPVVVEGGGSMWQPDERFGFRHVPAAKGTHTGYAFSVYYTLDDAGNRITPDPPRPFGSIVITGCSWTFGDGVRDEENYPFLLARDYWPRYKVVNASSMAWGTTQALLAVEDALAAEQPPGMVLYGFIAAHLMRNYRSQEWLDIMARFDRRIPHFELEGEELVFKGVMGPEAGLPPGPELHDQQASITTRLIVEMAGRCREMQVPFAVVSLPVNVPGEELYERRVREEAQAQGVTWIDIKHVCGPEDFLPKDGHPAPSGHEKIARAIASHDAISAMLR